MQVCRVVSLQFCPLCAFCVATIWSACTAFYPAPPGRLPLNPATFRDPPVQACTACLWVPCGVVDAGPMPDKRMPIVLASTRLTEVRGFSDFCSEFFQVSHQHTNTSAVSYQLYHTSCIMSLCIRLHSQHWAATVQLHIFLANLYCLVSLRDLPCPATYIVVCPITSPAKSRP